MLKRFEKNIKEILNSYLFLMFSVINFQYISNYYLYNLVFKKSFSRKANEINLNLFLIETRLI